MPAHSDLVNLIQRAQSNDVGAISELYDQYAGMILRYFLLRVYEHELAQDLTQEVFIKVIKGIVKFEYRDEKSFLGWLYTIASNILSSYQRRRNVPSTPLDNQEHLADGRSQHDVRAICDRVVLQQAIDQLTNDQQQVLFLRFFADMTNGEIAEALHRTEGAIKAIQYRALNSLHRILSRETNERLSSRTAQRIDYAKRLPGSHTGVHYHDAREQRHDYDVAFHEAQAGGLGD